MILSVAALVSCYATNTATAHWTKTPYQINKLHGTSAKIDAYRSNLNHAQGVIRFLKRKNNAQHFTFEQWTRTIRAHRYIIKYSASKISELTLPSHYAGWICIHNREGAWYSDTGNGFYNGLQMTWNWGHGIYGDPNNYTPLQIIQAAERGYRSSGYSSGWMSGQWPNTYPPCSSYF